MACEISEENLRPKSLPANLIIRMINFDCTFNQSWPQPANERPWRKRMTTKPTVTQIRLVDPENAPQPIKDTLSRSAASPLAVKSQA